MRALKFLFRFFERARAESAPWQLALGVVFGMAMAFIPIATAHWVAMFFILIVVRINLVAMALSFIVFFPIGAILEPAFQSTGNHALVKAASIHWLWAWMYHAPLLPYTYFNNTVVAGATFYALVLAGPLYFLSIYTVKQRQDQLLIWFYDSTFHRAWLNSPIRKIYEYHFKDR